MIAAAGRAFDALTSPDPLDLATVTADTFRPHVGTRFKLSPEARAAFEMTLTGVESQPSKDGATDTFTLRFQADLPVDLDQAIQRLDHAALGGFGMFLVPRGPQTVDAVVSHLLS